MAEADHNKSTDWIKTKFSYFSQTVNELIEKLTKEKPVEDHIHSVVVHSQNGRISSLGQHLIYRYKYHAACALIDHQYCKTELFDKTVFDLPVVKENNTTRQDSLKSNLVKPRNSQTLSLTKPLTEQDIPLATEETVTKP